MQEVGRINNTRCFDVEVFDDQFDPSALVATTRSLVPLERLRDDLQEHLTDRKQELFDLINRDYADFILVSSKLSGVGAKVADLKDPMASLLERASGLRSSAEIEAAKLEAKLEERRGVRERKRSIQRCLRFVSTLETAEGVLGISDRGADRLEDEMDYVEVVGDGADGAVGGASGLSFLDVDEEDEGFDDPDLLEAFPGLAVAAAESESRPKSGPGLAHDGRGEGGGEGAREEEEELMVASKAEAECALLERAAHYALMMNANLQAAAEDEASGSGDPDATSLVRGLSSRASRVEAEITRRLRSEFASLLKPRQEWVFGTAMAAKSKAGKGEGGGAGVGGRAFKEKRRQALLSCLRPFSALGSGIEAEKQFARAIMQPFLDARFTQGALDGGERGSGRGLGPLLDELIAYVKEVAGDAVEFAEEMFAIPADLDRSRRTESGKKEGEGVGEGDTAPLPVDLVCNGVWRPLQQVLMTRLSAIFATGMVAAQRKNFALCMEFLERLAGVGGEEKRPRIRQRLLVQPCMAEFKSRWNLPIYFQLRSREISSRLEAALSAAGGGRPGDDGSGSRGGVADAEEEEAGYEGPAFEQQVFREAWRCLMQCWDDEVFLPCLAHRFLRLSLQGIARVGAWAGSAEVTTLPVDDIVPVAASLGMLLRALKTDFVGVAAGRISSPAPGERHREGQGAMAPGDAEELVGEAVAEAAGELEPLVEKLWQEATSQVARQCKAILQAVKGITATYRMTNKPAPQRPSPFVPNVLRALREFDARWGASSASKGQQGSKGGDWKDGVVLAICDRYLEIVSELLLTVRQMENTLNKRRVTARRGSRAGAADQGPSDKDKIMMQLRLDVHEFGKEAGRLGVDVSSFAPYEQLLVVVEAGRDGDGASVGVTSR